LEPKEESDWLHCPSSCGIWTFFLLATTDERSLARTAPSVGAVLGRLAAGNVVIWAEEATRGCTTCCFSAEFAAAIRGAVVFSAIVGGPALASAGDAETAIVAAIPSAAATDTTAAVAVAAVAVAAVVAAAVIAAAVAAAAVAAAAVAAAAVAAAAVATAAVSSAAAVSASAVTAAAAFGWEVERVPGCREDFLLSSHLALLSLFFSNVLGFAGRLLDRFLLTAVLPAEISLHVKLSCCLPCFVCSTNLAGVQFMRHSQTQYSESALKLWAPESV
jgi:hypothetical protein